MRVFSGPDHADCSCGCNPNMAGVTTVRETYSMSQEKFFDTGKVKINYLGLRLCISRTVGHASWRSLVLARVSFSHSKLISKMAYICFRFERKWQIRLVPSTIG